MGQYLYTRRVQGECGGRLGEFRVNVVGDWVSSGSMWWKIG